MKQTAVMTISEALGGTRDFRSARGTVHAFRGIDLQLQPGEIGGLELSGGEQQRVALARALVHSPRFIVADEPTGNLDSVTSRDIAALLRETAHQSQIGLLVATHDATLVEASDRVLNIQDGRIVE